MKERHTPLHTPTGEYKIRGVADLLAPDILDLLDEDPSSVAAETEEIHPADLADIAEALPRERVADLLRALAPERAADILEYLDEELRSEVLERLPTRQAADLVTQMTPDDRADVLEELEEERADEILAKIPEQEREETERLLAYEADTAGGLMTTEYVSVSETSRVEDALAGVRRIARAGRREAMHAIYAIDDDGVVKGVMSLTELLAAPEGALIREVAWEEVVTVAPQMDREEVARLTSNYDLVVLPVVDENHRILGVVTVDDVIDALVEEHTEDVQRFGGMEALDEPYTQIGFFSMIRKRGGWLSILLIGEMATATVMKHFEIELSRALVLTLFIPLIMSSGGNSGSQATSLIIRAMALGEVKLRDWWRIALRELPSGVALGIILGLLGVARVLVWQYLGIGGGYGAHYVRIAAVVGFALVGVVTFGSLAGSMLPFVLRRIGFDPASASAPFVATLVDVTALSIYFYVAVFFLRGTLL
ncbi:MAG TPA: magnesium transporter [Gemmatimonadaceae bacterium]|nr:magnesium transporter [Gemmatimonadaceae bacterium]